jgi:DNA-binding MarR family transcriptional regulator
MVDAQQLASELAPRAARLVRALARERGSVSRTGVSVLASLRDGGPLRITELAAGEHVTQPAMTALVKRLERRDWVERQSHPSDGRVVMVALTAAGRDALAELSDAAGAALAVRIARLTAEERSTLAAALPVLDKLVT